MVRFDVTQANYVETGVQKAVPTSGADAAVYDAWAKVGKQTSDAFLDIYEKRDIAAANNYSKQKASEAAIELNQYNDFLNKNAVDGFYNNKSISDLMMEKTKQIGAMAEAGAPTPRAKAFSKEQLTPLFTASIMKADSKYTEMVAEGASRRLTETEKNLALSLMPDATWSDASSVVQQAQIAANNEMGNIDADKVEEFTPRVTRTVFDKMLNSAFLGSRKQVEEAGANLNGPKAHEIYMAAATGTKNIAVRNGDHFEQYNPVTKEMENIGALTDDPNALCYDIDAGKVLLSKIDLAASSIYARAFNPDDLNKKNMEIYRALRVKTDVDNGILTRDVSEFKSSLKASPHIAKEGDVSKQGVTLRERILSSPMSTGEKYGALKDIDDAMGEAMTLATVDDLNNVLTARTDEDVNKFSNEQNRQQRAITLSMINKETDPELYQALVDDYKKPAKSVVEKVRKAAEYKQAADRKKYEADAFGTVATTGRMKAQGSVISANLFDFNKPSAERLENLSNPDTLYQTKTAHLELKAEVARRSTTSDVTSKANAERLRSYIDNEKTTSSDISAPITSLNTALGSEDAVAALIQSEHPELSVLNIIPSEAGKLRFLDSMRQRKALSKVSPDEEKDIDKAIRAHKDFGTISTEFSRLGGNNAKIAEDRIVSGMRAMVMSLRTADTNSNLKAAVSETYKEIFGGRTTHSGRWKYSYDPNKIDSSTLAMLDEHHYNIISSLNLQVPEGIEGMAGMTPLEQSERYKQQIKDTVSISSIGKDKFGFFNTIKKNGITYTIPLMYKNPTSGLVEQVTYTAAQARNHAVAIEEYSKEQYEKNKAEGGFKARVADFLDMTGVAKGKQSMFSISDSDASKLLGASFTKVPLGADDTILLNRLLDTEADKGFVEAEKKKGKATAFSKTLGRDVLLENYTVTHEGKDYPQSFGGILQSKDTDLALASPSYREYKKNGYKFKGGTPEAQAEKKAEWYKLKLNILSKAVVKEAEAVGIDRGRITVGQQRALQMMAYKLGPTGAIQGGNNPNPEYTKDVVAAFKTGNVYLLARAFTKLGSEYYNPEKKALTNNANSILKEFSE